MRTSPTTTQRLDEINYQSQAFGAEGRYFREEWFNGVWEDEIIDWDAEITSEDEAHIEELIARYGERPMAGREGDGQ